MAKSGILILPRRRCAAPAANVKRSRRARCHMRLRRAFVVHRSHARITAMPSSQNRFLDDLAKLFQNAAGMADGARREVEDFFRARMERILAGMDLVTREEFEAAREMAVRAREENERLAARIAALEAK